MVNKINHTQFEFFTLVLRIRITLKQMRILLFTSMQIRILPLTLIRMRIRIQLSSFPDPTFQFYTNPDADPTFNFGFGSCFSIWWEWGSGSGFPLWCGCGFWSVSSFPKWCGSGCGSATLICQYDKKRRLRSGTGKKSGSDPYAQTKWETQSRKPSYVSDDNYGYQRCTIRMFQRYLSSGSDQRRSHIGPSCGTSCSLKQQTEVKIYVSKSPLKNKKFIGNSSN